MGRFKKRDSLIPEATEGDVFGQHAVALMKRIQAIGYDAAMQEELANPTWDDPDWCRMVVARASGEIPVFQDDSAITFRCHKCRDTGFLPIEEVHRLGTTYRVAQRCDPCAWRLSARADWLRKQEHEGHKGSRLGGMLGE